MRGMRAPVVGDSRRVAAARLARTCLCRAARQRASSRRVAASSSASAPPAALPSLKAQVEALFAGAAAAALSRPN